MKYLPLLSLVVIVCCCVFLGVHLSITAGRGMYSYSGGDFERLNQGLNRKHPRALASLRVFSYLRVTSPP